jgi:hypothetical protein
MNAMLSSDVDEVLHARGGGNARLYGRSVGEVILNAKDDVFLEDMSPPQGTNYQARSMKHLADDACKDTSCIFLPYLASVGLTQQLTRPL